MIISDIIILERVAKLRHSGYSWIEHPIISKKYISKPLVSLPLKKYPNKLLRHNVSYQMNVHTQYLQHEAKGVGPKSLLSITKMVC